MRNEKKTKKTNVIENLVGFGMAWPGIALVIAWFGVLLGLIDEHTSRVILFSGVVSLVVSMASIPFCSNDD